MTPTAWPDAACLCLAAILGGADGQPVNLSLRNFAVDEVNLLWQFLRSCFDPALGLPITSDADVRQAEKQLAKLRIVFVPPLPRHSDLHQTIIWKIESHRQVGASLPAVLSVGDKRIEVPGPCVVLDGLQGLDTFRRWLGESREPDSKFSQFLQQFGQHRLVRTSTPDRRIQETIATIATNDNAVRKVVAGLMAGARSWNEFENKPPDTERATWLQAYRVVHRWLGNVKARRPADAFDPLLTAMLRRSNDFLAIKQQDQKANCLEGRGGESSRLDGSQILSAKSWSIDLRELADLGNVRSDAFRRLLNSTREWGRDRFSERLGLKLRLPPEFCWPTEQAALEPYLLSWSYKQVRDRFGRLRKDGFISAERHPANGPLRYLIPEEILVSASPYDLLPTSEAIACALDHEVAV